MEIFLAVFDTIRFMTGLLVANLLFVAGVAERRKRFFVRVIVCGLALNVLSSLYVLFPIFQIVGGTFWYAVLLGGWWLFLTFQGSLYTYLCFKITPTAALFYGVLATTLQQVATVVVRLWFVHMLFPDFPSRMPALYVLFTVGVYAVIYTLIYFIYIRKFHKKGALPDNTVKNYLMFFTVLVVLSVVSDLTNGVFEVLIPNLQAIDDAVQYTLLLQYFCIGIQLLVCFVVFLIQYNAYSMSTAQREKSLAEHLFTERSRQYEVQKGAIDVIKRQAHDLKHQISALEMATPEDRQRVIGEMKEAIDVYDKVVHTDNEVLSTILSERSLQCSQRQIKLSCNILYSDCSFINTIDMYTMLGNALDNAIESVSKLAEPDKKTISFTVENRGNILCFMIENYYEGTITLADGLPQTTKSDKSSHGIGLHSIRRLAKKYGGDMRIDADGELFTLQIMLPIKTVRKI